MGRSVGEKTQAVLKFIASDLEVMSGRTERKIVWYRYRVSPEFDPEVSSTMFAQILKVGMNRGMFYLDKSGPTTFLVAQT